MSIVIKFNLFYLFLSSHIYNMYYIYIFETEVWTHYLQLFINLAFITNSIIPMYIAPSLKENWLQEGMKIEK